MVGANDIGHYEKHVLQAVEDIRSTMELLQSLNQSAQVYCCDVLPRRGWSDQYHVPLFHLHPNKCAESFNEQLHAELGNRVIGIYDGFCKNKRPIKELFKQRPGVGQLHLSKIIVRYIEEERVERMVVTEAQ